MKNQTIISSDEIRTAIIEWLAKQNIVAHPHEIEFNCSEASGLVNYQMGGSFPARAHLIGATLSQVTAKAAAP